MGVISEPGSSGETARFVGKRKIYDVMVLIFRHRRNQARHRLLIVPLMVPALRQSQAKREVSLFQGVGLVATIPMQRSGSGSAPEVQLQCTALSGASGGHRLEPPIPGAKSH